MKDYSVHKKTTGGNRIQEIITCLPIQLASNKRTRISIVESVLLFDVKKKDVCLSI